MKLHVIDTGFLKLDGGAMFGVVPKTIWNKTNPSDENNLCTWAMRCLLIEEGNKLILIDNGIGNKQNEKFLKHYYLHGDTSLQKSLKNAGFDLSDITDNLLTHLHFDHCGGGTVYAKDNHTVVETTFSSASYWCHSSHWDWALHPNSREKASFLQENLAPLESSGQLKFVDKTPFPTNEVDFLYVDGHTEKQTIPLIKYGDKTVVFAADLIPSVSHIPIPYVMGYDTRPLITMQEKEVFLNKAVTENYILFFEHDPINECCTLQKTEKGIRVKETFKLRDI